MTSPAAGTRESGHPTPWKNPRVVRSSIIPTHTATSTVSQARRQLSGARPSPSSLSKGQTWLETTLTPICCTATWTAPSAAHRRHRARDAHKSTSCGPNARRRWERSATISTRSTNPDLWFLRGACACCWAPDFWRGRTGMSGSGRYTAGGREQAEGADRAPHRARVGLRGRTTTALEPTIVPQEHRALSR